MRIPPELEPLIDLGVIDDVLRPLMSGKEAQVYLVTTDGEERVAKVYKNATHRSFKHRADYTEGRRTRNTRQERAKGRRSRYGRGEIEAAWRTAEVDAMYRLRGAGVRVPEPYDFVEGVLVMELIRGEDGAPAPRLIDVELDQDEAKRLYQHLLREVTRMLCAGMVHGDLSDFNVLLGTEGPVIIDLPQVIDAAANRNARRILIRDVDNLTAFLSRWVPDLRGRPYGEELWGLYERGELTPDTQLTGRVRNASRKADVRAVVEEIAAAAREETRRRAALGLPPVRGRAPKPPPEVPAPRPAPARPAPPKRAPPKPNGPAEPQGASKRGKRRGGPRTAPDDPFDDLDALLTPDRGGR